MNCPDCTGIIAPVAADGTRLPAMSSSVTGGCFCSTAICSPARVITTRWSPFNRWGQDGPAIEQRQVLATPPPAPAGLLAEVGNGRLQLSWHAPALSEGMELLGYHIYRRRPGHAFAAAPRNSEILGEPRFEDNDFEPGRTYVYAVRTLVRQNGEVRESTLSDTLVITPRSGF
ncbi:MAG: hypothetical protein R2864_08315 [Syntrophotaleaceae bacterium]